MANEYTVTRWGAVDQTTDLSAFVSYLDTVTTLETVRRMKQRTYELLQVREGHRLLDVGCGLGDDVRALAQQVGTAGRMVGVDRWDRGRCNLINVLTEMEKNVKKVATSPKTST
ncbi:MAG: class I SAM-dependent methyltransferase [Deltaproteobacteria bacterium]|nr:class I SAM-dependent methyltransferase [Deltaproteobacteria bacterium]